MRLDEQRCWARLADGPRHGVLATVHAERGVDAVPVVFAVHGREVLVPVDAVKAKSGRRLQRLANLEHDPRCALLVDHYDDDWSQLWWVRLHGRATEVPPTTGQRAALAAAHPPYRDPGSITTTVVLRPTELTGWAAG